MNTEKLKLSEKITERRTDRLDEWSMDDLSRDVSKLETKIAELTKQRDELEADNERMNVLINESLFYLDTGVIECAVCSEEFETKTLDVAYLLRSALRASQSEWVSVPEGYKLVPIEPTKKMQDTAAFNLCNEFGYGEVAVNKELCLAAYRELVSAAPKGPSE